MYQRYQHDINFWRNVLNLFSQTCSNVCVSMSWKNKVYFHKNMFHMLFDTFRQASAGRKAKVTRMQSRMLLFIYLKKNGKFIMYFEVYFIFFNISICFFSACIFSKYQIVFFSWACLFSIYQIDFFLSHGHECAWPSPNQLCALPQGMCFQSDALDTCIGAREGGEEGTHK